MLLYIILALLLTAMPGLTLIQSFSEGCLPLDGQFYGQDKVGFYCFTQNEHLFYDYMYSTIDLRHCLGNNRGTLVGYKDGNYQDSCDNCTLRPLRFGEGSTCYIECECYDMEGRKKPSTLDLNEVLKGDNGYLICYDHRGTRDRVPPPCHHNIECSSGEPRLTPRSQPTQAVW